MPDQPVRIEPIFACIEFDSMDNARKAWRQLRDSDTINNVSAWTMRTPVQPWHFLVTILGEKQENVDRCGEALVECEGAVANFLIEEWPELIDALLQRRYGLLAREWQRAKLEGRDNVKVRQEANYQSGRVLRADGTEYDL